MKIVKIKNNILNIGKKLSVIAIISSVTTYILTLFFYAIEHSGVDVSLSYIFTMLFYFCLFASVIILSVIFINSPFYIINSSKILFIFLQMSYTVPLHILQKYCPFSRVLVSNSNNTKTPCLRYSIRR